MKYFSNTMVILILLSIVGCSAATNPANIQAANGTPADFYANFISLDQAYNPAVTKLYADTAKINISHSDDNGKLDTVTFTCANYKIMLTAMLQKAKEKGFTKTYSNPVYTLEGENVRIRSSRNSDKNKATAAHSLLVMINYQNQWVIIEEELIILD